VKEASLRTIWPPTKGLSTTSSTGRTVPVAVITGLKSPFSTDTTSTNMAVFLLAPSLLAVGSVKKIKEVITAPNNSMPPQISKIFFFSITGLTFLNPSLRLASFFLYEPGRR
jgi:hypothetical protein